jgi:uncharacterized oxidoreductase
MKHTNNTILITGGSAGIGFAMAKLFSENGNHVIITGRKKDRLESAAAQLTNVTAIQCDVTDENEVAKLVARIEAEFPQLNMVINNAGSAYYYKLEANAEAAPKATKEITTNYLAIINLTEKLLPTLQKQENAAVVNVSSIVAFAPSADLATYSASKAALHSYTRSLRHTLSQTTNVKVFELMPPLVNTNFSKDIGGENGIAPEEVAMAMLTALKTDNYEVRVGNTELIYQLSLSSPDDALAAMNTRVVASNN